MEPEPVNKRFMYGSLYIFLITGAIVVMTSSILTYLMHHYSLNYDQGGLLLSTGGYRQCFIQFSQRCAGDPHRPQARSYPGRCLLRRRFWRHESVAAAAYPLLANIHHRSWLGCL